MLQVEQEIDEWLVTVHGMLCNYPAYSWQSGQNGIN
jgi:hypothetical protein